MARSAFTENVALDNLHQQFSMLPVQDVEQIQHEDAHIDTENPLNWSSMKKHRVILALASASLLCDLGMTWGTTLFETQAQTWDMPIDKVANSISGGLFLQGPGGVLAVPLTQRYGRLPVLFWSQLLSCVVVTGSAVSPSYTGFTICRTLQGLVNTAPQVIGLSIIHDMYHFRDRVRKVNLWAFSFFCGPFLGPFISAWLVQVISWRAVYGVLAAMHMISVILIITCGEETLYVRKVHDTQQGRTRKLARLVGSRPSSCRPTLVDVLKKTFRIAVYPHLLLPTAIFTCVNFMWAIGIITTITQFIKPPPYLFAGTGVALIYLAPFIGVLLAEVWGHFFNEYLQRRNIHRHNGDHSPEHRLWAVYPAAIVGIGGLVLYGQTLQRHLHWIGLAVGWAMVAAGFLASTTAVSAYALDCFQGEASAASSWINFWRTTGGFCVSYFQLKWVRRDGAAIVFGWQAAALALATSAIIITQRCGNGWRQSHQA